jgi:hypothetical protein
VKEKPTVIERGRLTYLLFSDRVLVKVNDTQWVSYNQYTNWSRQGIATFRNIILKSKEDEYTTAPDQMTLAHQCGIIGASTGRPSYDRG